jgi:N-acetylglucosamine-6-phosphate deacetylase
MKTWCLENVRLVLPGRRILRGRIVVGAGKILSLGPAADVPPGATVVQGGGRLLTPGLIDMHTHGFKTYCYERGADDLLAAARELGAVGTTTILPTVVPTGARDWLKKLAGLEACLDQVQGVSIPGFHLEGPFMALRGAACDLLPGDVGWLNELVAASKNRISVMSISPETPHIIPVIERLRELGIVPFVTHTQMAIEAGARHATHFYDVFPVGPVVDPGVRPAGVVESFLADSRASVDFIPDGCHVHPVVIQMAVQAKGWRGVSAITDGNIGSGLPPGEYPTPWGYPVYVEPGRGARCADKAHPAYGKLAGSALTMDVAMSNLGTANPARVLGLKAKGLLEVGAEADLVLWNADKTAAKTWVNGELVFEREESV